MSGKHCPDCRGNIFSSHGTQHQCQLCGWIGDLSTLPNSAYQPIFYERVRERHHATLAGKFFTVRVVCAQKDVEKTREAFSKLFNTESTNERDTEHGTELRLSTTARPTNEQITTLEKIGKVRVFPEGERMKKNAAKTAVCDSQLLTAEQKKVLLEKGTEAPFTGKYLHNKKKGEYTCAACGNVLFMSHTKFDSGTGWPSFSDVAKKGAVLLKVDLSHGMKRIEAVCAKCSGHLGHVFDDGPTATGKRYCINSLALGFKEKSEENKVIKKAKK